MTKEFKYSVEIIEVQSNKELQKFLDEKGEIGWELINTHIVSEIRNEENRTEVIYRLIFKYEVTSKKNHYGSVRNSCGISL